MEDSISTPNSAPEAWRRYFSRLLAGLSIAFYLTGLVLSAFIPPEKLILRPALWPVGVINLSLVTYAIIGGLIIERKPRNRIGWIFLLIGFAWQICFPSLLRLFGLEFAQDALQSFMALEFLLVLFTGAAALITRLRKASGVERQQIKWFCFAGVFFAMVTIGESAFFAPLRIFSPAALVPADLFWGIPAALAFAAIPVAAAIAILRYRLYEIDSLIRRTLIFGALSTILAIIYSCSVLLLEQLFQLLTGQVQSPIVIVLATLGISALFEPLRRLVQQWIERRFYRRKYDAEQVLARFSAAARNEVDLNRITGKLLDVVDETMQPEQVTLLLNKGR